MLLHSYIYCHYHQSPVTVPFDSLLLAWSVISPLPFLLVKTFSHLVISACNCANTNCSHELIWSLGWVRVFGDVAWCLSEDGWCDSAREWQGSNRGVRQTLPLPPPPALLISLFLIRSFPSRTSDGLSSRVRVQREGQPGLWRVGSPGMMVPSWRRDKLNVFCGPWWLSMSPSLVCRFPLQYTDKTIHQVW